MAIPKQRSLWLPLLRVIAEAGGELHWKEAINRVEAFFPDLTDEDRRRRLPSGNNLAWPNSVQWARWRLVRQGYLYRGPRGIWRITPEGEAYLRNHWETWRPEYRGTGTAAVRREPRSEEVLPPDMGRERLRQLLHQVGIILGFHVEVNVPNGPHLHDVVWRESPGIMAPKCVFEIQDRANVLEGLAHLQRARHIWRSDLYLVVTGARDRAEAEQFARPLLDSAYHLLAPHLVVLAPQDVEELHAALAPHADLLERFLKP